MGDDGVERWCRACGRAGLTEGPECDGCGVLLADLETRRTAALDALRRGRPELTADLGLSANGLTWYRAYTACVAGDTEALIGQLEQLPQKGYAARADLLLARAVDLAADNSPLAARAAAQLRLVDDPSLDTRALAAVLTRAEPQAAMELLLPYAEHLAEADPRIQTDKALAEHIAGSANTPTEPDADGLNTAPAARALFAYLRGMDGATVDDRLDDLRDLPLVLLDELIDRAALTESVAQDPRWPRQSASYLRCRLAPDGASDTEIKEAMFTAEMARRAFLTHSPGALDTLPADDPAVRHYAALESWRRSRRCTNPDNLRPQARALAESAEQFHSSVADIGAYAPLPPDLAADPTTWPLFEAEARGGALRLAPAERGRHPELAQWLDLHRVQGLIFDRDWENAADAGDRLAARTTDDAVRAEALNMAALAKVRSGETAAGAERLDRALAAAENTSLHVNAALVARVGGCLPALPHLAAVAASTADGRLADNAVNLATRLWFDDDAVPDYPDALRGIVRTALSRPLDDKLCRRLLQVASSNDTTWLAREQEPFVANDQQADMLRFYRTRARARTNGCTETLASVAEVLGQLASESPRPPWVSDELEQLEQLLDDGVHCDFGQAAYLSPAIDTLLTAEVLSPTMRLLLPAQAGAHLAAHAALSGDFLTVAAEQRLLLDACDRFDAGEPALSDAGRQVLGLELARCLRVAAVALVKATDSAFDESRKLVAELSRAQDTRGYGGTQLSSGKKQEVIKGLEEFLDRLRGYRRRLSALPAEEDKKDFAATLTKAVLAWSAEINSLRGAL